MKHHQLQNQDWQHIDTVLLDMDGTLLDLHFDNYFWQQYVPQRYAEIHRSDALTARAHIHALFKAEHGSLNWYCLDHWSATLELDILALKREVAHLIKERPHTLAFLRALQHSGKRVVLITNAHQQSLALKMERTRIKEHLDVIISAHDLQAAKEHAPFWPALQEQETFAPQRTLFIDDTSSVLAAAHDYGIKYLLTIAQPDSSNPPRPVGDFPVIHDFDEIMPSCAPV